MPSPATRQDPSRPSSFARCSGAVAAVAAVGVLAVLASGHPTAVGPLTVLALGAFALFCRAQAFLRSYTFTVWVFTFVAGSLFYPQAFGTWFGLDLKNLIVPLVQIIMFGMGTTLSVNDFARVLVMPVPVLIGLFFQFTIMPLTGYAIAKVVGFPPEIAAGVILIGSVSSGAASNLITYLSRGNVALAVSITAISTLLSPVLTPLLMKFLAGKLVPIDVPAMVVEILNMVIVPVVAGLVTNRLLYSRHPWFNQGRPLGQVALGALALALGGALLPAALFGPWGPLKTGALLGLALIGVVALAKLLVTIVAKGPADWMNRALPVISMAAICFIIAIITARSREKLLTVGAALILAAIMHNSIGYLLGYWCSRLVGQDEITCRTIAIEVGMQNGGMASGLAMSVLHSPDAALAPAIFGPWMNISGSVLASYWRRRPIGPIREPQAPHEKPPPAAPTAGLTRGARPARPAPAGPKAKESA